MKKGTGFRTWAAAVLIVAVAQAAASGKEADAGAASRLAQAIANTDSARSYRELDTTRISQGGTTLSESSSEVYDQVRNRERDHAAFVIARPGTARQSYSVDVVMANNHTYYRSTLDRGGWKVRSGYGYADPISGQRWIRSPLTFAYLERQHIASQETTGSTLRVRFRNYSSSASGSGTQVIDVWVSSVHGSPYIVRYKAAVSSTVRGKRVSESVDTHLSGFNEPVTIAPPTLGA